MREIQMPVRSRYRLDLRHQSRDPARRTLSDLQRVMPKKRTKPWLDLDDPVALRDLGKANDERALKFETAAPDFAAIARAKAGMYYRRAQMIEQARREA
jgi:hypothetical protein